MYGFFPYVRDLLRGGTGGKLASGGGLSGASDSRGRDYDRLLESGADISFPQLFGYDVVPIAYRCITMLTWTAAGLPLVVCRDGKPFQRNVNHDVARMMRDPARLSNISGSTFWTRVFLEVFGKGYSVIHIRRRENGVPRALENAALSSHHYGGALNLSPRLTITVPGRLGNMVLTDIPQENVIILYDESWNPFLGKSEHPLESKARNPVDAYKNIMLAHLQAIKRGGHQKLYMSGPMTKTAIKTTHDVFDEQGGGPENAGLPFHIGPPGTDLKAISHSAEQQQTRAMMDFLGTEICRAYGVDPRFAYDRDAARSGAKERAGSNLPEENTRFLDHGFRARLQAISGALTQKLLPPNSRLEIVFDTNKLTLGTLHDKAVAFELLTARSPGLTPNEGREYILDVEPDTAPESNRIHPTKGAAPAAAAAGTAMEAM